MKSWDASRGNTRIFACWTHFAQRWRRRGIRGCQRRSASGGTGARSAKKERDEERTEQRGAEIPRQAKERPRNKEEIGSHDAGSGAIELAGGAADARVSGKSGAGAAGNSRLGKPIAAAGVLLAGEAGAGGVHPGGGDRRSGGRAGTQHVLNDGERSGRLANALEREEWTTQRERPPFLTWMALSWQARPGVFLNQLKRRRKFLLKEIAREKKTMLSIYDEVGHKYHEAVWMVGLMIEQMRVEVRWTHRLERESARRAEARYPQFAEGLPQ